MAVTINETVQVDMTVDQAKLKRSLDQAQRDTKKANKIMQKEWKNTSVALGGVVAGLTLLVKTGLKYNKQIEETVNVFLFFFNY